MVQTLWSIGCCRQRALNCEAIARSILGSISTAHRGAAGWAEAPSLDDLPGDGKAAILAELAQALDDRLVLDFLGGAAIVANHELAFVRMLDIVARNKGADAFDFVNQLVRDQKIERTINRRWPSLPRSLCSAASSE